MGFFDYHLSARHVQCSYCDEFTHGPFAEQNPGRTIYHADEGAGELLDDDERRAAGKEMNISHGSCRGCNDFMFAFKKRTGRWPSLDEVKEGRRAAATPAPEEQSDDEG